MESDAHAEHIAMLALLQERPALAGDTSWPAISAEVSLRGSARALWHDLHPLTFDGMDFQPNLDRAHARLASWRDGDFRLITVLDDDYPMQLRTVHDMPPILFVKGHLHADDVGVSVAGARAASQRGRAMAAHIATGRAERGIMVISGLAAGIDTAAHRATHAAGGLPIGVIGTGISGVYPDNDASAQLHRQVATAGALVSQFWPNAPPHRHNSPLRNATMSGLGYASVIVEAGEHSGTRVEARAALAHGRPVILTDTVAAGTQWGQALTGRPGVYVAAAPPTFSASSKNSSRQHATPTSSAFRVPATMPSDRTAEISRPLTSTAGGYLHNTIRETGRTCSVCAAPVDRYPTCWRCQSKSLAGLADLGSSR